MFREVIRKMLLFTTTLVLFGMVSNRRIEESGPFDIRWKYMEDCSTDDTALIKFSSRVRKSTRTTLVVEGLNVVNITLDDNIKPKLEIQKFTPSGWKANYLIVDFHNKGACTCVYEYLGERDVEGFGKNLKRVNADGNYTDLPIRDGNLLCPLEPGVYMANNIVLHTVEFKNIVPIFFYGSYRGILRLYTNDFQQQVGCWTYYGDVIPKKRRT